MLYREKSGNPDTSLPTADLLGTQDCKDDKFQRKKNVKPKMVANLEVKVIPGLQQ
jgi:hypothetical protein